MQTFSVILWRFAFRGKGSDKGRDHLAAATHALTKIDLNTSIFIHNGHSCSYCL